MSIMTDHSMSVRARIRLTLIIICALSVAWFGVIAAANAPEEKRMDPPKDAETDTGPSFDCAKASSEVERVICSSPTVSRLDRELAELYGQLTGMTGQKESFKRDQLEWLRSKRARCSQIEGHGSSNGVSGVEGCLKSVYEKRIDRLNALGKNVESDKKMYEVKKGRQYDLCHRYVDLMNRVSLNPVDSCDLPYPFDEIAIESGFSEISWSEMDKSDHNAVLVDYWTKPDPRRGDVDMSQRNMETKEGRKAYAKFLRSIESLWRATVDMNFDKNEEMVYRLPVGGECSGRGNIYFISDSNIPAEPVHRSRVTGNLFYFKGRVYIYYGTQGSNYQGINETYGSDYVINEKYICEFELIDKGRE